MNDGEAVLDVNDCHHRVDGYYDVFGSVSAHAYYAYSAGGNEACFWGC